MASCGVFSLVLLLVCCASLCHAHLQHSRGASSAILGDEPNAQQMLRWGSLLLTRDDDERNDENDASSEELQQQPEVSKRRKGPTLSVVSPLEVLRQRLRLDRAKERIRENQKQIVANEELLEKIGKRSMLMLNPPSSSSKQ